MIQSIVTTFAIVFMMFQTSFLDQVSRWEMDLTEERCRGCCTLRNDSLISIINEPYLSEKLHKFSRAVRKYDIPEEIVNILHEAEHKIEEFEKELKEFKQEKVSRISQLQETLIEEDIKDQELIPKGKPKWQKPTTKTTTKPTIKHAEKQSLTGDTKTKTNVKPSDNKPAVEIKDKTTRIANDVHKQLVVNVPV